MRRPAAVDDPLDAAHDKNTEMSSVVVGPAGVQSWRQRERVTALMSCKAKTHVGLERVAEA